jgi:hypothetical protein
MTICDMAGFEDSSTVLMGMLNHPVNLESREGSWEKMARLPSAIIRRLSPDWDALTRLPTLPGLKEIAIYGSNVVGQKKEDKSKVTRPVVEVVKDRADRVIQVLQSRLQSREYLRRSEQCLTLDESPLNGFEIPMMAIHFALVTMRPLQVAQDESSATGSYPLRAALNVVVKDKLIRYIVSDVRSPKDKVGEDVELGTLYVSINDGEDDSKFEISTVETPGDATASRAAGSDPTQTFNVNWLGPGRLKVNQGMFINATIQTFLLHTFRQSLLASSLEKDKQAAATAKAGAYRFGAELVSLTKSGESLPG